MQRAAPFMLLLALASAVVASPVALRGGDPALDGNDYLISEQDFRDILKLCHARLGSGASKSIYNVRVLRRDVVAAYFGSDHMQPVFLWVSRTKKGWKIDHQGYGWYYPEMFD
jgi:hypothetical protein